MANTDLTVKTPELLNALTNKFVDLEGLKIFWANAKSYVDNGDSNLQDQIDQIVSDAKTYSISKVTENLGENVKEAFQLVDEDGTPCGETINIYKDSSLINVELVAEDADGNAGQFLKYTYVLANGTEQTEYVNVSQFLVEAEFKNGLEVSAAGEVSVKIDTTSEAFLTVGEGGVKLSGVQAAINAGDATTLEAAKKYTDEEVAKEAEKRVEEDGKLDARITDLENTVNGYTPEDGEKVEGLVEKVAALRSEVDALGGVDGGIQGMIDTSIATNNTNYVDVQDVATLEAAKAYTDELANGAVKTNTEAINTINTVTVPALEQGIADAESNANTYTDEAIAAIEFTFASHTDIDGIFEVSHE